MSPSKKLTEPVWLPTIRSMETRMMRVGTTGIQHLIIFLDLLMIDLEIQIQHTFSMVQMTIYKCLITLY